MNSSKSIEKNAFFEKWACSWVDFNFFTIIRSQTPSKSYIKFQLSTSKFTAQNANLVNILKTKDIQGYPKRLSNLFLRISQLYS